MKKRPVLTPMVFKKNPPGEGTFKGGLPKGMMKRTYGDAAKGKLTSFFNPYNKKGG